jgi:hypothetical protein
LRLPGASVIDVSFGVEGVIVTVRLRRLWCRSCGALRGGSVGQGGIALHPDFEDVGFHAATPLIALAYLCCTGIEIARRSSNPSAHVDLRRVSRACERVRFLSRGARMAGLPGAPPPRPPAAPQRGRHPHRR